MSLVLERKNRIIRNNEIKQKFEEFSNGLFEDVSMQLYEKDGKYFLVLEPYTDKILSSNICISANNSSELESMIEDLSCNIGVMLAENTGKLQKVETEEQIVQKEELNKIPSNMIEMFKANASTESKFVYNPEKTLKEQNVSEIARTIIAILFRDYWATETQREKILSKQNYDRKKIQEEMYSQDNLFKRKKEVIQENSTVQQLVLYKEPIFRRIFNKILTFLRLK